MPPLIFCPDSNDSPSEILERVYFATIGRLETYKDWAFVAVTASLLHAALSSQLQRWKQETAERKEAEEALR